MRDVYMRIGRFCFRKRKTTVVAWLLLIVGLFVAVGQVGSDFSGDPEPPEGEADGFDLIQEHFGEAGAGPAGTIVFVADQGVDDPEVRSAMEELFVLAESEPGVTVISPYGPGGGSQIARSGDLAGRIAFARVALDESVTQADSSDLGARLFEERPQLPGLQVEIGGQVLAEFEPPESEMIGLAFAVVVLIVSFGSVLAMGLPIAVAIAGVSSGIAAAGLLSNFLKMPEFATTIAAMIGLGVGIDYALFIVTRYRENLHLGDDAEDANTYAMDTAGRAVVFAGVTVIASLLGLGFMGMEFVAGLGVAAAVTVLLTMLASTTLLPAMLGFARLRVEVTRWRGLLAATAVAVGLLGVGLGVEQLALGFPVALGIIVLSVIIRPMRREIRRRTPKPLDQTGWYRWSRLIQRRPWRFAIGGTLLLGVLASPLAGIRLGFSDEGNFPEETTTRRAYDLLADGFGPGSNGLFFAVAEVDGIEGAQRFQDVVAAVAGTEGVASVTPGFPNDLLEPTAMLAIITPETSPQDQATEQLVDRLRDETFPQATADTDLDVLLTGYTVVSMDMSQYMGERSLVFFGVVLIVSFVLLMMVFRSLLVPLKAVIMNMLSIAAAYGVVVAVFQWGWLSRWTTIEPAPIEPFVPMMMFAIVFGLSMDYEVFLLSRIREEYARTDDAVGSVANGLAATARVISAAAAIMVVVFGSFLLEDGRIVKVFGTGLGLAVLLDATLVRMLLVPATMELLGRGNWWIPRWLNWLLPNLNVEGHPREQLVAQFGHERADAPAPEPEPVVASSGEWQVDDFTSTEVPDAPAEVPAGPAAPDPSGPTTAARDEWEIPAEGWESPPAAADETPAAITPDDLRGAVAAVADAFTGGTDSWSAEEHWDEVDPEPDPEPTAVADAEPVGREADEWEADEWESDDWETEASEQPAPVGSGDAAPSRTPVAERSGNGNGNGHRDQLAAAVNSPWKVRVRPRVPQDR